MLQYFFLHTLLTRSSRLLLLIKHAGVWASINHSYKQFLMIATNFFLYVLLILSSHYKLEHLRIDIEKVDIRCVSSGGGGGGQHTTTLH